MQAGQLAAKVDGFDPTSRARSPDAKYFYFTITVPDH